MRFVFRISGSIKVLSPAEVSDTSGQSSITIRMEYLYLLSKTDIVNFVWQTHEGEAEGIVLLIFFRW